MTLLGLFAFLPGLMGFALASADSQSVTRVIIQDEVIVRVPVRPLPMPPKLRWVAQKGPKCIPVQAVRGALLSSTDYVDFIVLNGSRRVRAEFDGDCQALDFYEGFYLRPDDDGRLCVHRDSIYSRIGGSCRINKFKLLVPTARTSAPLTLRPPKR